VEEKANDESVWKKENEALNELLTRAVELSAGMGCDEMDISINSDREVREIECTAEFNGVTCRTLLSFETDKPGWEG